MPDKQRGDVEFAFVNGYFASHSHFSNIQLYQLFEREITAAKPLPTLLHDTGFVLLFFMTGSGDVTIDGASLPISSNTVVITRTSSDVMMCPSESAKSLRYVCLNMDISPSDLNDDVDRLYDYYLSSKDPIVISNAVFVRHCMSLFIAELCASKPSPWLIMGYLDQLMIQLRRAQSDDSDASLSETTTSNAVGHTVYAIICYIDEHLFTMNSLMDMARDLGYSYNYLSHVFRKKTGLTIQTYVSQKKIERSKELLKNEQYSITEIASMLNYDCIQSFSKAFRKVMHMSPTEFRAKHGITE